MAEGGKYEILAICTSIFASLIKSVSIILLPILNPCDHYHYWARPLLIHFLQLMTFFAQSHVEWNALGGYEIKVMRSSRYIEVRFAKDVSTHKKVFSVEQYQNISALKSEKASSFLK